MEGLQAKNRSKLRRAIRSKDPDAVKDAKEAAVESELKDWKKRPEGRYGLVAKDEVGERGPALVAEAWDKLRRIARPKVRSAMDRYEAQQGGAPRFDTEGRVNRKAGGTTRTRWRSFRNGFRQEASREILVGAKFICRVRRSKKDFVLTSVMRTLIHELMGHWDRVGQKVEVEDGPSRADRVKKRKAEAERKADGIDFAEWRRIKRTTAYRECLEDLEEDFQRRCRAQRRVYQKCVDDFVKSVQQTAKTASAEKAGLQQSVLERVVVKVPTKKAARSRVA